MKNKMDKLTVILLISALSFNAFSLRCGNQIIQNGDSVSKVEQYCGDDVTNDYQVKNSNADVRDVTVTQGGMNNDVHIVDGNVQSIEGSR